VPPSAASRNTDKTILLAEDDAQLRKAVAALLDRYGYTVIVARDGSEALQKAREFNGAIHLLLSDIDMPGMTGIELATELNQQRPDTKILLVSGLPTGTPNNGWQFLPKPFTADMLRDRILNFLLSEHPQTRAQAS
jgi:DNA-binding response OmpR family regulator